MNKEILKDEMLAEKFLKKWSRLYLFAFLVAPSGYIIRLIISNDLSVNEVWIIYSIIGFVWLLSNYNDLGFTESLLYFLPKFWINKKYNEFKSSIFLALWIQTLTAILIAIWLWFWSDWLANNYFHSSLASEVLKVFSLWFIVFNIFRTIDTIFQSFQDTFHYRLIDFIRMWSIVVFCLIIFFSHIGSVLTYSLAWFFWTLVWLIVWTIIFIKKYRNILKLGKIKIDNDLSKQLFSYSIWVIVWSQAGILLWQIDQQMIIYFLGPQQAGYYTNYLSLLSIYSLILGPLFWFLFPVTTELAEKNQNWKLSIMLSIFLKYFWIFGIYWWIFVALFWPTIAFVLFWKKFIPSGKLLSYSAWFIVFNIFVSILFWILAGLGKIKQRVKILWLAAWLNFILNLILIPKIWILWAIISTIIWWIIMFILALKEVIKNWIEIKIDWKFIIKNLVLAWILGLVIYFSVIKNIKFDSRLDSLWLILWIGLVYWGFILGFNPKEVKLLLNQINHLKTK